MISTHPKRGYPFTFPFFSCVLYIKTNLTYNIQPMSRWGMLSYTANESICFYTQIFGKISQTEDKSLPSVTGSTPNVLLFFTFWRALSWGVSSWWCAVLAIKIPQGFKPWGTRNYLFLIFRFSFISSLCLLPTIRLPLWCRQCLSPSTSSYWLYR